MIKEIARKERKNANITMTDKIIKENNFVAFVTV